MSENKPEQLRHNKPSTAVRARPDERLYAKHIVLDRILASSNWIGSSELKAYVERHCSWAEYGTANARSRTIDNWLKGFRRQAEDTQEFEFDNEPGKGYRYKARKRDKLTLETANLVLLAERLLHLDIHIVRELAGKNADGLLTAQILALESSIRADLNISLQAQTNIAKADDVHGK